MVTTLQKQILDIENMRNCTEMLKLVNGLTTFSLNNM